MLLHLIQVYSSPKIDLVVPVSTPETPNVEAQKVIVTADVHAIPVQSSDLVVEVDDNVINTMLQFPMITNNCEDIISLPVSFDNGEIIEEMPDLGTAQLEEILVPNPAWNAEYKSIFLPHMKANPPAKKRNSSATLSRILTSSEIINAKKEQEENKIQKAEAVEERKARAKQRAEERKAKAEQIKIAKLLKQEKQKCLRSLAKKR